MNERKRVLFLILIMATASMIVVGIAISILYRVAHDEQRARLVETAQSQARLIEAVARFNTVYSKDYTGGPDAATLSQIVDAHEHYKGFGETGEFTLANRKGNDIVFLLSHRHHDLEYPKPIPFDSELAEPMRRALSGLSGTVAGLDYRGELVLAAHEPVAELNLGIVAKIDLSEVREPFLRSGMITLCITVFVVFAGAALFLRISNPMVKRLQEHTDELTRANEQLQMEVDDRKRAEDALQNKTHDLNERVKELNCLYEISHLRDRPGISLEEFLKGTVDILPPSWQFPDITCARIILEGKAYMTENFAETKWTQAVDIIVHGEPVGNVEVFYLKKMPESDEGPFLREERSLINAIAERLGKTIEHLRAEEALAWESVVDSALSQLYEPLITPRASIESMTSIILDHAKALTASEHGYAGSIDPVNGDLVSHTLTEMMRGQCRVSEKNKKIVFPRGNDGSYPALWGHPLNRLESFFTNSPKTHSASTGLPKGHLPLKRFLSVPVMLGEELVGQIALANKADDYTARDLAAIRRLAEFYALAIQRNRVNETMQKANKELEVRVEERTAEIRRLSSRFLSAQEEERKRIARELHDGIGQSLSAIKFRVEHALQKIGGEKTTEVSESLDPVVPTVQKAVEEVRRISRNLRPSILDDLGLLATISWFCREFQSIFSQIRIEKQIDIQEDDVPDFLKIVIFRILQEALNNIAKHSQANLVRLPLRKTDTNVELTIYDDGIGFNLENVLSEDQAEKGLGLASMKERTQLSGGSFSIESTKGKGTTIRAKWPVIN
ncbi:GAF domain-containing protein [bacterium]|nr:GAF domain-containing protein [bacterium]